MSIIGPIENRHTGLGKTKGVGFSLDLAIGRPTEPIDCDVQLPEIP